MENPEIFWNEVWDSCGVIASRKGSTVLVDGDKMPGARWFPEARLNFAENLLRRGDRGDALVFWDENGLRRRVSYSDLTSDVSRAVQALLGIGLRAGDRAAAFIPNLPETSMLALAALSQGIVWSSCSPDFGVDGVIDRFGQIEPKVLFCADGYRYNGQTHDSLERVREIAERLPTVRKVVVVPYLDPDVDVSDIPKAVRLDEWLRRHQPADIALCAAAVQSPGVRAVHFGHHRQAEVHRARRRRHAAAVAEDLQVPLRRPAGRPLSSISAPPTGWCGTCSSPGCAPRRR